MCAQVRSQLQDIFVYRRSLLPTPALCEHVAECPLCRGALALLLADAVGVATPPPQVGCERCQHDLAALIDMEDAEGTAVAIQHYPSAWWHLWTCPLCAETYQLTRELLVLEPADLSAPPAPIQRLRYAPRHTPLSSTLRPFLFREVAVPLAKAQRGSPGKQIEFISNEPISDDPAENRLLTASARRQRNGHCRFDVRVQPRQTGELVFSLGEFVVHAHFDAEGWAQVRDVPFACIAEPTGPDLVLALEQSDVF